MDGCVLSGNRCDQVHPDSHRCCWAIQLSCPHWSPYTGQWPWGFQCCCWETRNYPLVIPGRPINSTETADRVALLCCDLTNYSLLCSEETTFPKGEQILIQLCSTVIQFSLRRKAREGILGGNHHVRVVLSFQAWEDSLLVSPPTSSTHPDHLVGKSGPEAQHPMPGVLSHSGRWEWGGLENEGQ